MSLRDITTDAQLTPWQKKTLELARCMVNEKKVEYFIPHINFVELYEDGQNGDTRIHNLGHIIPWMDAITRNAGSIVDAVVFGPPRNLICAIIDRLVIMGNANVSRSSSPRATMCALLGLQLLSPSRQDSLTTAYHLLAILILGKYKARLERSTSAKSRFVQPNLHDYYYLSTTTITHPTETCDPRKHQDQRQ